LTDTFRGEDKTALPTSISFADPQVAILPRGGWGCSVLPYLDYERIRQNPKILVGFSDLLP